jgi:hypothetical protein
LIGYLDKPNQRLLTGQDPWPVNGHVHFVPDPRGPVLEGDFTERVERAESPAADFQIAADFIPVRVPLLPGEDGLLGILVP